MEFRIVLLINVIVICFNEFSWVLSQGNRGVIINNQKLENSNISDSIIPKIVSTQFEISTMRSLSFTPNTPIESSEKHLFGFKRRPRPNRKNGESKNSETSAKNLNKIISILNRNQTDLNKIDELVMQMNSTGSLTQINLINVNEKDGALAKSTPAPKIPSIESVYRDKDSKELKVQFVLDCDLKDSLDKEKIISSKPQVSRPITKKPFQISQTIKKQPIQSPPRVQPQVVYYPISPTNFFQNPYQTALLPTKFRPNRWPITSFNSVTKQKPTKVTTTKPIIKNVYVDPPAVATISNTFDNIYNYFEDVLTTKVKIPNKQSNRNQKSKIVKNRPDNGKLPKRRPIVKRSTVSNSRVRPSTISPRKSSTKYRSNDVQHLTTKIHVTSEYVGKDPTTTEPSKTTEEYSEEYEDDDDDDDGESEAEEEDDYYDSFSFDGFGLGGDDDDDDEGSYDDENSSDYDEEVVVKKKRKLYVTEKSDLKGTRPKKRKQKPQPVLKYVGNNDYDRHDSYSDESSSEYSDMDFSVPYTGMSGFFDRMGSMFSPVGKYVPNFLNFGKNYYDDYDEEDDKKTNKNQISQPNQIKDYLLRKGKNKNSVLRFFYSSGEETTTVTTPYASHEEQSTESSFFDWFSDNNNKPSTTESTHSVPMQNWFSNIFGVTEKPTTTTTTTPNPLNAQHIMAVLASQISTTPKTPIKYHQDRRIYYDDYQIWRIIPSTNAHVEFLREYKSSGDGEHIQWLKGPSMRGPTDILVPPSLNKYVQEALEYESVPYEIVIWDLEKAIKYENPVMTRKQKIELEEYQGHPMTWYRYHDYDDILTYLDYLQITYPDIVDLIHIGRSFEGRPLVIVKISFQNAYRNRSNENSNIKQTKKKKKVQRPGIFIEGGTHGREWISPAVTTWLLRELVKYNRTIATEDSDLVQSVDWYILPVSNPDGYEYSLHYDRMWRKTRSKLKPNKPSVLTIAINWLQRDKAKREANCYGTDPNRNYDTYWGGRGSSNSPCSDFYAGPKPFSEPETKNLAKFLDENKKLINLFLSLHSYGQMIMYPSTSDSRYSSSQKSNDLRDLAEIAANGRQRDLSTSGRYIVDSTNEMMDYASGTMTDYAMHETGIKYCYTIELRDSGTQGFLLSPTYIEANGKEIFEMIKTMIDYI